MCLFYFVLVPLSFDQGYDKVPLSFDHVLDKDISYSSLRLLFVLRLFLEITITLLFLML